MEFDWIYLVWFVVISIAVPLTMYELRRQIKRINVLEETVRRLKEGK